MTTLFQVGVSNGVPNSGTGTASTIDNLMTAGLPILDGAGLSNKAAVKNTTAAATDQALVVALSPNGINGNGQSTMENSSPIVIASDQTPISFGRTSKFQNVVTIATTTETVIATASVGSFHDIYGLILANTSGTASTFIVKDVTAGTTKAELNVPAGDTRGFMLPSVDGIPQGATNSNWTGTLGTSISGMVVTVLYVSKTA